MLVGLLCIQRSFGGEASIICDELAARLGALINVLILMKSSDLQDQSTKSYRYGKNFMTEYNRRVERDLCIVPSIVRSPRPVVTSVIGY